MLSSASPMSTSVNESPFFVVSAPGELRFLLLDMMCCEKDTVYGTKWVLSPQTCAATCGMGKVFNRQLGSKSIIKYIPVDRRLGKKKTKKMIDSLDINQHVSWHPAQSPPSACLSVGYHESPIVRSRQTSVYQGLDRIPSRDDRSGNLGHCSELPQ